MHHMCDKCKKMIGAKLLILGIAFLLVDLGVWSFWNIKWWTVLFIFMGLKALCVCKCPECQKLRKEKKK